MRQEGAEAFLRRLQGGERAEVWEIKVRCHPCRAPCSSVQLWQGTVAAGYGNGQVRLYEASTGTLHVQISAHARAVCALDLAPEAGKVSLQLCPCIPLFPGAGMLRGTPQTYPCLSG